MNILQKLIVIALMAATLIAVGASPADASVVQPGDILHSTIDCDPLVTVPIIDLPDAAEAVDIGDDGGDAAGAGANAVRWTETGAAPQYISIINCRTLEIATGLGDETVTISPFDAAFGVIDLDLATVQYDGGYVDEAGNDTVTIEAGVLMSRLYIELGSGNDVLATAPSFSTEIEAADGPGADILQGGASDDRLGHPGLGGLTDLGPDRIFGRGGNDDIYGSQGNDFIKAGGSASGGFDNVVAQDGDDRVWGGGGVDLLNGGNGDDEIDGQGAGDIILGAAGDDILEGGAGADSIHGGAGNDVAHGRSGPDTLRGNDDFDPSSDPDNDQLFGGVGNDVLAGDRDFDKCSGGPGNGDQAEAATCEQTPGIEVLF